MCHMEHPRLERLKTKINSNPSEETCTEIIVIKNESFSIGRSDHVSHSIIDVLISRNHCIFTRKENIWTITDFSKFGTKLNGYQLTKEKATPLNDGDIITLDCAGTYTYKFFLPGPLSPAKKKIKLSDEASVSKRDIERDCARRFSETQQQLQAAQRKQHQFQEEKENLESSHKRQFEEIEAKYQAARQKLEQKNIEGEIQQKNLEKEKEEMEAKLKMERDEISAQFEKEKELLQSKVEEQKQIENKLKEDNEKLALQIEADRKEFQEKLAKERRLLEETMTKEEQARKKAEEEKAVLESQLLGFLEQQKAAINNINQQREQETFDKQKLEDEHQKEKQELEEKVKEMERALREKEEQQKALSEELARKEEEKARELETLKAQQEAENQKRKEEMENREQAMRTTLDTEINKLKNEKLKLEADIRVEMNVESFENKNRYEMELEKVKKQLTLMESKKQVLEQELANNTQEKEKMSENCIKAKQRVLEDVSEVMQSELQCQICSELYVVATTLNCTHTFCKQCISEWKQKQTKTIADCPVCRAPIHSENRSIALDNFIDKMVESLSDDLKEQRRQLLQERNAKAVASTSGASTSNAARQVPIHQGGQVYRIGPGGIAMPVVLTQVNVRTAVAGQQGIIRIPATAAASTSRGGHANVPRVQNPAPTGARQRGGRAERRGANRRQQAQQAPAPRNNPVPPPPPVVLRAPAAGAAAVPRVVINAPQNQQPPVPPVAREVEVVDDSLGRPPPPRNTTYISSDDDEDSEELIVAGLPTASYGGFGRCFNCGMKGHWAPGCPFNRR